MPKQGILVATDNKKTIEFLTQYFADTQSIPTIIRSKGDAAALFSCQPDILFFQGDWCNQRVAKRLTQFKSQRPQLKCFTLGHVAQDRFSWDGEIELPIEEKSFRKTILTKMKFPEQIKLVMVDDEPEIIELIQDYFEVRKDPAFQVRTALNGLEGFKLIQQDLPHCLILDIKMPVRTGVELYRDLVRSGHRIPTVIFIDSTAADDILEIRKCGSIHRIQQPLILQDLDHVITRYDDVVHTGIRLDLGECLLITLEELDDDLGPRLLLEIRDRIRC